MDALLVGRKPPAEVVRQFFEVEVALVAIAKDLFGRLITTDDYETTVVGIVEYIILGLVLHG